MFSFKIDRLLYVVARPENAGRDQGFN